MSDEQANAVDGGDDGAEPSADPDAVEGEPSDPKGEPDDTSGDAGGPPVEEIAERVGEEDPDAVAEEIATLREEVAALERDRDDLESRLKRKQAEFQNYKKRQEKRRER